MTGSESITSKLATPPSFKIKSWKRLLGRRPRVLVVEDDREILISVMEWFNFDGWKVRGVDNGSAFFEIVEPVITDGEFGPEYFDALITDISMPGINVVAILEGLRQVGSRVPVAVISALPDPALPDRIHRLGRSKFFAKPFEITRLHQDLCHMLVTGLEVKLH